ncbi:MAG TPA: tRNA uridine-5-carboxymethylaminomethyl(34) synthesis GTPase MnmE [Thermoanaerobaculia bacterium]
MAPATPPGTSALAVVRLSGPRGVTLPVVRQLVPDLPERLRPREARLSEVVDARGILLDRAIVLFFEGPHSSTGEDVVEIHCHGSPAVVRGTVEAAIAAGARPARKGEFSWRALVNGKVDLAEAEGVALLCSAGSRGGAARAIGMVSGLLSRRVEETRSALLDLLAGIEAALDFQDDVAMASVEAPRYEEVLGQLSRLLACRVERAGDRIPTVAIVGRPNAGKSSLFNALLGTDRAIVTAEPGTTRDVIGETGEICGEAVRLYDTAGMRIAASEAERLGVEAAERAAENADLVLEVLDGSDTGSPIAPEGPEANDGRRIVVESKRDLWSKGRISRPGSFGVSVVSGEGLADLRQRIAEALSLVETEGEVAVLDRHRRALVETDLAVREAVRRSEPELAAADLRHALTALGEITGETASEELLDRIFSTFCLGK